MIAAAITEFCWEQEIKCLLRIWIHSKNNLKKYQLADIYNAIFTHVSHATSIHSMGKSNRRKYVLGSK
jgi:hypothetical protein